ncbi:MAG: transcription antitermination factor NusB [Propionicimonas sp.]
MQHAILAGDEVTGVTVFELVEALDAGPVLAAQEYRLGEEETAGEALAALQGGAELLSQTLDALADGTASLTPQPPDGVTPAPKLTVEGARIDWTLPAVGIARQVRANNPSPVAWTELDGERFRVLAAAGRRGPGPRRGACRQAGVVVGTGDGSLELRQAQPAGRRARGRRLGTRACGRGRFARAGRAAVPGERPPRAAPPSVCCGPSRPTAPTPTWSLPAAAATSVVRTRLRHGACRAARAARWAGTTGVIEAASGRALRTLQPAVVDVLRLGTHQLLGMRVPAHAAIATSVDLAALEVGERVTGLVNAVLRRVAERDWPGWLAELSSGEDELGRLALATHHPRWIVEAWSRVLPAAESRDALAADNVALVPNLVVRPPRRPRRTGRDPRPVVAVRGAPRRRSRRRRGRGRGPAGAGRGPAVGRPLALARAEALGAPGWMRVRRPGGKSALLAGLAREAGTRLVASELQPHRAQLVAANLRAYGPPNQPVTIVADGTRPAWRAGTFARVLADVPCTGLGALRRRPESRWRRSASDLPGLVGLQRRLLARAIEAAAPGGVIAYVTCSPHPEETAAVVADAHGATVLDAAAHLPEVPDAAAGNLVQLWPHRHGTDAMFLALLRREGAPADR